MAKEKTHKKEPRAPHIWSLQRDVPLIGIVVLLVLGVVLSLVVYTVINESLHDQYDTELRRATAYIEHNTDVDDLAACIADGQSSPKRDKMQTFVNTMIDDLGLEYIYIVIPDVENGKLINVLSATNAAERANGEEDMSLLEETDAYSKEELQRYRDCWDAKDVVFFEEKSDYGTYYTACKPLRDSNGQTVALLCLDMSSRDIHKYLRSVVLLTAFMLVFIIVSVGIILLIILRLKAIKPIVALADSATDFAEKSAGMTDYEELRFEKPEIDTKELRDLADAIDKMAVNMREYVTKTRAAEQRAKEAAEENARLAEKAKAENKINMLTESVRTLFNNMPAMTFSKDARTGEYLACNQAFAADVGKASPQEVVGLKDADIYDEETAKAFAERDEIVLSMDAPYMYVEDVTLPDGSVKRYQTTKIKFVDGHGRLCILGMCSDTTELMLTKQQSQAAQEAYEEAKSASLTYANIARALALDYSYIYYVDAETDAYAEYRSDLSSENLVLERHGDNFFRQSVEEARDRIYYADQEAFFNAFGKEIILKSIEEHGMFTLTYRLVENGKPAYYSMKITKMVGDDNHLVVGVNNVDAQMRAQEEVERAKEEHATFARISALSGNYICIYTVDPKTEHYLEYNVTSGYETLRLPKEGDDFFETARRNGERLVFEDDRQRYLDGFTKENVMDEIQKNGLFAFEYRMTINGAPNYVRLKAAIVEEMDGPQMVVGVSDIDQQIKREQEFTARINSEHNKAYEDALTGFQNKHAYVDAEAKLNHDIEIGRDVAFAVVVLDINGLKYINDTEGHRKGDALIIQAGKIIAAVFRHSVIYRIGGDEFAILARGEDYEHIDELVAEFAESNARSLKGKGIVVACGMARYQEGDANVSVVFERADVNMYRNKKALKGE